MRVVVDAVGVRHGSSSVVVAGLLSGWQRLGAGDHLVLAVDRPSAIRRLTWGRTFRTADALLCVSERTRRDLLARRPALTAKAQVMPLGADHVLAWARDQEPHEPYVLAFGHIVNKNAEPLIRAWARFAPGHPGLTLHVLGLAREQQRRLAAVVDDLRIRESVQLLPWLSDADFQRQFTGARAVVFPSGFEGFGLPALEAMRLGLPLVVSDDPALAEVTGGLAVTARSMAEDDLGDALERCLARSADELRRAQDHAAGYQWERTAATARAVLTALCSTQRDRRLLDH